MHDGISLATIAEGTSIPGLAFNPSRRMVGMRQYPGPWQDGVYSTTARGLSPSRKLRYRRPAIAFPAFKSAIAAFFGTAAPGTNWRFAVINAIVTLQNMPAVTLARTVKIVHKLRVARHLQTVQK